MSAILARDLERDDAAPATARALRIAVAAGSYVSQRDGISVYTENLLAGLLDEADARGVALILDVYACASAAEMLETMLVRPGPAPRTRARFRVIGTADDSGRGRFVEIPRRIRAGGPYDCVLLPNLQPIWLRGERTVAVLHDLTYRVARAHFPRWRYHYMDLLTRWHLRADSAIACISRTSEEDLLRFYPAAVRRDRLYLPNGLPVKLAATPRIGWDEAERKLEAEHLNLLFVGRLNRLKGFDRVRRFCALLEEHLTHSGGRATVHVVGKDTPETPGLLDDMPQNRVQLVRHGYLDDAELNVLYRRSAYCLFLSRNEGFGLPLMEAIWQRCVPLLSEIDIFREVMGPGYPLFAGDDDALRQLVGFVVRMRADCAYRRGILARMESAMARWRNGYGEAAAGLLDWVLAHAREQSWAVGDAP